MTGLPPPPAAAADDVPFEPAFLDWMVALFEQRIPFNRLLGLRIEHVGAAHARGRIDMRPELIGHVGHARLHGGVISAVLDAIAGLAVMSAVSARHLDETLEQRRARTGRLGTIDLRIDYLRQATGPHFIATGQVLRLGSRLASVRMELHDAEGRLTATGAAAYVVS